MPPCLTMRGVAKAYEAGIRGCYAAVTVLRQVDLDVDCGELVALIGAPAAGKTTLLLVAAGLLRPERGVISWFGHKPSGNGASRPAGIAYVGDRPFPYGFLTVQEALEYSAIVRELPLTDNGRVASALDRVGLAPFADRRVDALDRSLLARLSLAAGLLIDPRLLLVDELPSGCDARTAADVLGVLREVAGGGAGVVVAGYALTSLAVGAVGARPLDSPAAARALLLHDGRLRPLGNAAGLLRAPASAVTPARVAELMKGGAAARHRAR